MHRPVEPLFGRAEPSSLDALVDDLARDLEEAGYFDDRVRSVLGDEADGARARGMLRAADRVLRSKPSTPLSILIGLFLLGLRVAVSQLESALPRVQAEGLTRLGLIESAGDGMVRACVSLNPVRILDDFVGEELHWWVASDLDDQLRGAPARHDHVMGVGAASRQLIALLPALPTPSCLDLGTGCGIVAMHLAQRGPVVATDLSERALRFARFNVRLNRRGIPHPIEFRAGDLFEPVADDQFALIASNPPFVITPRSSDVVVYEYRDAGVVGDALVRRVIVEGSARLQPEGTLLCLANWEAHWGTPGLTRVRQWIDAAEPAVSAWVMERDRVTPLRYAETWARDGGARGNDDAFALLVERWLDDFHERQVVGVGLGSIRLRRDSGRAVRIEEAAGAYTDHPGREFEQAFSVARAVERMSDADVLEQRWLLDDRVSELREYAPGSEHPRRITLQGGFGVARSVEGDPLLAAALGACDGELSLRQIAAALAQLLEVDTDAAADALVASVRELVWLGFLTPGE